MQVRLSAEMTQHTKHSNINISQGSVDMHFRCGGVFNDNSIAQSLISVSVKEMWKYTNIWWSCDKNLAAYFFHSQSENNKT